MEEMIRCNLLRDLTSVHHVKNALTKKDVSSISAVQDFYGGDVAPRLGDELKQLYRKIAKDKPNINFVMELCNYLREHANIFDFIPSVVNFIKIYCSLPCTTCECERFFSELRRLKTYLRSTMTQERVNSVMILQIKSSLYSRYYAEACNEWQGSSSQHSARATQLRRNVAAVASRWRHCANLTGPGIKPQTSRTESMRLATELTTAVT